MTSTLLGPPHEAHPQPGNPTDDPYLSAVHNLDDLVRELSTAAKGIGEDATAKDLGKAVTDVSNSIAGVTRVDKQVRTLRDSDRYQRLTSPEARQRLRDETQTGLDEAWAEARQQMMAAGTVAPGLAAKLRQAAEQKLEPTTETTDAERTRAAEEIKMRFESVPKGDPDTEQREIVRIVEQHGLDSPHARVLSGSWGNAFARSRNMPESYITALQTQCRQHARTNGTSEQRAAAKALDKFDELQLDSVAASVGQLADAFSESGPYQPREAGGFIRNASRMSEKFESADKITIVAGE